METGNDKPMPVEMIWDYQLYKPEREILSVSKQKRKKTPEL